MTLTYLLPLRRSAPAAAELVAYLNALSGHAEVVVIDGSPAEVFDRHAALLDDRVTHVAPSAADRCANGKAWGVRTGLRVSRGDAIVIADDDVRWDGPGLARVATLLGECDLVVPQNHFSPLPWHAAWDTGRTLLNRATGHDWPGTLALRRGALRRTPAYDGDVLFENCELVRTVGADGGRVLVVPDLLVARRPPSFTHFAGQRPRQAYDDVAQPLRLAVLLAVIPILLRGGRRATVAVALLAMTLAERGRRRGNGRSVFPWYTSLCAPLWVGERSVLAWWTVWRLLTGQGVVYGGRRITVAAHSVRRLRRSRPEAALSSAATSPQRVAADPGAVRTRRRARSRGSR